MHNKNFSKTEQICSITDYHVISQWVTSQKLLKITNEHPISYRYPKLDPSGVRARVIYNPRGIFLNQSVRVHNRSRACAYSSVSAAAYMQWRTYAYAGEYINMFYSKKYCSIVP